MLDVRPKVDHGFELRLKHNQASVKASEEPPRGPGMFLSPVAKGLQGRASRNLEIINNFGLPWRDVLLHSWLWDRPGWKAFFRWFFRDVCVCATSLLNTNCFLLVKTKRNYWSLFHKRIVILCLTDIESVAWITGASSASIFTQHYARNSELFELRRPGPGDLPHHVADARPLQRSSPGSCSLVFSCDCWW